MTVKAAEPAQARGPGGLCRNRGGRGVTKVMMSNRSASAITEAFTVPSGRSSYFATRSAIRSRSADNDSISSVVASPHIRQKRQLSVGISPTLQQKANLGGHGGSNQLVCWPVCLAGLSTPPQLKVRQRQCEGVRRVPHQATRTSPSASSRIADERRPVARSKTVQRHGGLKSLRCPSSYVHFYLWTDHSTAYYLKHLGCNMRTATARCARRRCDCHSAHPVGV
jgi:hypothetical protein